MTTTTSIIKQHEIVKNQKIDLAATNDKIEAQVLVKRRMFSHRPIALRDESFNVCQLKFGKKYHNNWLNIFVGWFLAAWCSTSYMPILLKNLFSIPQPV